MKRILFLTALVVAGTVLVSGAGYLYLLESPNQPAREAGAVVLPPPRPLKALPDVDTLASRMKENQDVYRRLRDAALATYAKENSGQHAYDADAQMTLRLLAYLWVWDDFYGEGLWRDLDDHANHLHETGCPGQIWMSLPDIHWSKNHESTTDEGISQVNACETRFGKTDYPVEFKLWFYQVALGGMISSRTDKRSVGPSLAAMPEMTANTVVCFQQLVAEHLPDTLLYRKGDDLLNAVQNDEPTLQAVSRGMDRAFEAADRYNPMQQVLDADFYTNDAWCARGSGWAGTVTPQGWADFGERLDAAERMGTDVYAKNPQLPGLCRVMMTVVLGRQEPRDQMELWFRRGIQNEPDNFDLYMNKRWYLLPRWYGSDEDVWAFGLECAQSPNWSAKIPLLLVEGIADRAENDPTVYADPAIWAPVEKIFRGYLDHYPQSVKYRSRFAKCAVQGSHWDVAKEQFKILGDDWDHDVFSDKDYAQMKQQAAAH